MEKCLGQEKILRIKMKIMTERCVPQEKILRMKIRIRLLDAIKYSVDCGDCNFLQFPYRFGIVFAYIISEFNN